MRLTVSVPSVAIEFDQKLLKKVLRQSAQIVIKKAASLIVAQGSGRKYGEHIASAPGEAPANLTGKLLKSFSTKVNGKGLSVTMADTAFYALILESGARGGGRVSQGKSKSKQTISQRILAPRPFLSMALDSISDSLTKQIQDAVQSGIDLKGKPL